MKNRKILDANKAWFWLRYTNEKEWYAWYYVLINEEKNESIS